MVVQDGTSPFSPSSQYFAVTSSGIFEAYSLSIDRIYTLSRTSLLFDSSSINDILSLAYFQTLNSLMLHLPSMVGSEYRVIQTLNTLGIWLLKHLL